MRPGGTTRGLVALGSLLVVASAGIALAQAREGWSPRGPLDGREPTDADELTPEERRHVPVMVLPQRVHAGRAFDFVAQVGIEPHVMTPSHHIDWIEVAVGEERVFVTDLTPRVPYPIVRIPLVLGAGSTRLTVRAHCTLHGTWRTRRAIEVR